MEASSYLVCHIEAGWVARRDIRHIAVEEAERQDEYEGQFTWSVKLTWA
jgi:hypothetical protein